MPDTKTLESAEVPIFQTHPTPVNVSVKPESFDENTKGGWGSPKKSSAGGGGGGDRQSGGSGGGGDGGRRALNANEGAGGQASTGCGCVIL